jgi:hypothetical protein
MIEDTIGFGQAIEIRWLQNQPGQPVPCDPNTGTKAKRRHTILLALSQRGMVTLSWHNAIPHFTPTEKGAAEAAAAVARQVAAEAAKRAAFVPPAPRDPSDEAKARAARLQAFRDMPLLEAYDAMAEVIRLYVDPFDVRPEHTGVVDHCGQE